MKFERASTYNFGATKLNRRRVSGATPDQAKGVYRHHACYIQLQPIGKQIVREKYGIQNEYLLSAVQRKFNLIR